jgi:hypothetical protein
MKPYIRANCATRTGRTRIFISTIKQTFVAFIVAYFCIVGSDACTLNVDTIPVSQPSPAEATPVLMGITHQEQVAVQAGIAQADQTSTPTALTPEDPTPTPTATTTPQGMGGQGDDEDL